MMAVGLRSVEKGLGGELFALNGSGMNKVLLRPLADFAELYSEFDVILSTHITRGWVVSSPTKQEGTVPFMVIPATNGPLNSDLKIIFEPLRYPIAFDV